MMCLATLLTTRPLVLQVSLFNPQEALGPIFVPRSLQPFGGLPYGCKLTDFRSTIIAMRLRRCKVRTQTPSQPARELRSAGARLHYTALFSSAPYRN